MSVVLACLTTAACTEVVSETQGTFSYLGREYVTLTRTYSANGRTYDRRVIVDGTNRISCSATDDRDCISVIEQEWIEGTGLFR
ncbi:hypothetical protein ACERZ8_00580 [Tateyamaria armeniaca]|uniref:Uncharacterized protein n=1 Tax=Tateyamaria armeniaca TaxID=2518930 RepID=A0ABW8UNX7_9RHOB